MLRCRMKPGDEAVIFLESEPAILADVLAESFLADRFKNLLREIGTGAMKEIDTLGHDNL